MTDLYKVYKSPTSGQWEYDVMTEEEAKMDARGFPGFGWIPDRIMALNRRNDMRAAEEARQKENKPGTPEHWIDTHLPFDIEVARALMDLQAQHDRSTAHYHSTDLSGIKEDVFTLLEMAYIHYTMYSHDKMPNRPQFATDIRHELNLGLTVRAWISEWEAKHLEELYK